MGLVAGLLALLGEFGHQALVQLQATAAHHLFHLVFPLLAVIVFSTYLGVYIRLDGWPTFSWRLRPAEVGAGNRRFPHRPPSSRE
jgi:hypothetical protein